MSYADATNEKSGVALPANLPADISAKIKKGGKIRRIVIDRQACIGARSCVLAAPGVFAIDEENLAYVTDPDSADDETIQLAAESCPTLAIQLYDGEGKRIFPRE